MNLLSDKSLYRLAWFFAALAIYFLVSAFYISSQGMTATSVKLDKQDNHLLKTKEKSESSQGEKEIIYYIGC